jgi:hypothetical protein
MDLLLIGLLVLVVIMFFFVLKFAKSSIHQARKGYQNFDEVNEVRKESLQVQKGILKELQNLNEKLDPKEK